MKQKNTLFIFSNGRVAAIDKKTGDIIWEIKIKQYAGRSMSYSYGQIFAEDGKVYVGCSGMLFCLNAKDGSLLWKNELKGWGYQFVALANMGSEGAIASSAAATTAAVISAAT